MLISDWSSDVCSSDLRRNQLVAAAVRARMLGLVGRHALVAPAPFTVVQQYPARIGIDAVTPAPFVETGAEAGFGQVRARPAGAGHHSGAVAVPAAVLAVGAVRGDVVAGWSPGTVSDRGGTGG